MDPEVTALPSGDTAAAGEQSKPDAAATEQQQGEQHQAEGQEQATADGEQTAEQKEAKKEKTQEQREIERLRRRVDNLTRQKYELRGQQQQPAQEQRQQASDDEPVTLSRAELDRMVAERAEKLAPAVKEQQAELERRQGVMTTLSKQWGPEKFNAIAAELDDVLGGLRDAGGRPKPATEAILEADDPKAVIEYLTDPDNADDAERFARSSAVRAGREIARIEAKLKDEKAKAKARPSNAARPIESVKGGGVPSGMPDPANTKAYIAWANAQERGARQ